MTIKFSKHAQERCVERSINDEKVKSILIKKKADKVIATLGEAIIRERVNGSMLNIVVAGSLATITVVTVYC